VKILLSDRRALLFGQLKIVVLKFLNDWKPVDVGIIERGRVVSGGTLDERLNVLAGRARYPTSMVRWLSTRQHVLI